ncbi:hypothetical protein ONE63_006677 [Megalurothrips usitatus]|uniref:MULE transposase domain-containing protein n=1 Tax=Megalurothrips usitatus TaxID=439358 RepID=A0AAV7XUS3_9NEOP|nr:hypothetical protein ONE63_006677 [Megalurothrips usitatus]
MAATLESPMWEHLGRSGEGDEAGEPLYQGLVGPPGRRSVVLLLIPVLAWLAAHGVIEFFFDGTFDIVPVFENCCQLLAICANYQDHVYPVAFAFMASRDTVAYEAVFQCLRAAGLEVGVAHADFEPAVRNAVYAVWERARVVGCVAHYATAVYRWLRRQRMHGIVQGDPHVLHVVRMVTAIPRAPSQDIPLAFRAVRRIAEVRGVYRAVYPVLAYVWREWISRVGGQVLSVFGQYHTTNNTCEVHHNAVMTMADVAHPNAWDLLEIIRARFRAALVTMRRVDRTGHPGHSRRPFTSARWAAVPMRSCPCLCHLHMALVAPVPDPVDPVVAPLPDPVDPVVAPLPDPVDPVVDPLPDPVDPVPDLLDPVVDPLPDMMPPVLVLPLLSPRRTKIFCKLLSSNHFVPATLRW